MSQLYACTRFIRNALNKECAKHPMKTSTQKKSKPPRTRDAGAKGWPRYAAEAAVVATSGASGAAALVALAAAWRQPIPGYGRRAAA